MDKWQHAEDPFAVVDKRFGRPRSRLEPAVVALCGENPLCRESRQLELGVDIGGHNERFGKLMEERLVQFSGARAVTAEPDVLCPVCPVFFRSLKRVERRSVEVGEPVTLYPWGELAAEVVASIVDACGSSETAARTDNDMVGLLNGLAKEANSFRVTCCRCHSRCP